MPVDPNTSWRGNCTLLNLLDLYFWSDTVDHEALMALKLQEFMGRLEILMWF